MNWKFPDLQIKGEASSAVPSVPESVSTGDTTKITRVRSIEAQIYMNRFYDSMVTPDILLGLPEVFFPVDFIASRISKAHFEIKRNSDDAIVWCSGRARETRQLAKFLARPNWLQSWREFVYSHFVQKLTYGNAFIRAAMNSDLFNSETSKWEWAKALWSIPASMVDINTTLRGGVINLFGCEDMEDVITGYRIGGTEDVASWQVFHDRDLYADTGEGVAGILMSPSRLLVNKRNITILKKVYDARNTIYDKCGALGIITNRAQDETGSVPMNAKDKQELIDHYNRTYGATENKSPTLVTDANLDFLKTGADISQLQPFEETFQDAVTIAGIYGIPPVLVPRKDQATYDNQAAAEKAVYTSVIIPSCEAFCQELTEFLGLKDYYISCNFDHVDCLQAGRKEEEQVRKLVNDRCRQQFLDGLISYNDWRAQIHESALDEEVFSKLRVQMTDEERMWFDSIISKGNIINETKEDKGNGNKDKETGDSDEDE
ncbi:MAG: phage portal protein [Muribaculaceae bacterium]|nr:phage portal protein [Muribaculaceae bacterium]